MKKNITTILSAFGILLSLMLFAACAIFGYIYFTVYDKTAFANNIASSIDKSTLRDELNAQIDDVSTAYGFDSGLIRNIIEDEDTLALAESYLSDYYIGFVNGVETFPQAEYSNEAILQTINDNISSAVRPEIYEIESNRILLADAYEGAVTSTITSLNINILYNKLMTVRDKYLKFTNIGRYFIPCLTAFVIVAALTLVLMFTAKKKKSMYVYAMLMFAISLVFSVPFVYLSRINLLARLTVSLGGASVYIKAVYDLIAVDAAQVFTVISSILLITVVASAIRLFYKRSDMQNQ